MMIWWMVILFFRCFLEMVLKIISISEMVIGEDNKGKEDLTLKILSKIGNFNDLINFFGMKIKII